MSAIRRQEGIKQLRIRFINHQQMPPMMSWQVCQRKPITASLSEKEMSVGDAFISVRCHARSGGSGGIAPQIQGRRKQGGTFAFKRHTHANSTAFLGQWQLNSLAPLPAVYSSADLSSRSALSAYLMMQRVTSRRCCCCRRCSLFPSVCSVAPTEPC